MDRLEGSLCIEGQLAAHSRKDADCSRHDLLLRSVLLGKHIHKTCINCKENDRQTDRPEDCLGGLVGIPEIVEINLALLVDEHAVMLVIELSRTELDKVGHDHQEDEVNAECAEDFLLLEARHIAERHARHRKHDEGEDEGIAEGQPVRHLSAVPHHVDRADHHAEHHHKRHDAVAEALTVRNAAVQEEERQKKRCQHTAVDLRLTEHIHRAVLVDAGKLRNELDRIELRFEGIVRVLGEIKLTERQCIVDRQDHECCKADRSSSRNAHSAACDQQGLCLKLHLLRNEAGVDHEIDRGEDAAHEADIEVCDADICQRNDEVQLSAVIDKILDAERDQRQCDQTVKPHRVDRLDDTVCAHAEHRAENHRGECLHMACLAQEVGHRDGCRAELAEDHNKQGREDPLARQEYDNQSEGAGKIIADDTLIAAGKVPRPVIQNAAVSVEGIADRLKVIHILTVQVEAEHGVISVRRKPEEGIRDIEQDDRNEEGGKIRPVPVKPCLYLLKPARAASLHRSGSSGSG